MISSYLDPDCSFLFEAATKPIATTTSNSTSNIDDIKKEVSKIAVKLDELSCDIKNHLQQVLANSFKCMICFESRPNSFYSCQFCGIYIGCFDCVTNISRCPICKKEFKCEVCESNLPKYALKIPGLVEYLGRENAVITDNAAQSINEDDTDDDLPIVL